MEGSPVQADCPPYRDLDKVEWPYLIYPDYDGRDRKEWEENLRKKGLSSRGRRILLIGMLKEDGEIFVYLKRRKLCVIFLLLYLFYLFRKSIMP